MWPWFKHGLNKAWAWLQPWSMSGWDMILTSFERGLNMTQRWLIHRLGKTSHIFGVWILTRCEHGMKTAETLHPHNLKTSLLIAQTWLWTNWIWFKRDLSMIATWRTLNKDSTWLLHIIWKWLKHEVNHVLTMIRP